MELRPARGGRPQGQGPVHPDRVGGPARRVPALAVALLAALVASIFFHVFVAVAGSYAVLRIAFTTT